MHRTATEQVSTIKQLQKKLNESETALAQTRIHLNVKKEECTQLQKKSVAMRDSMTAIANKLSAADLAMKQEQELRAVAEASARLLTKKLTLV